MSQRTEILSKISQLENEIIFKLLNNICITEKVLNNLDELYREYDEYELNQVHWL